jgi:hypothetical protein
MFEDELRRLFQALESRYKGKKLLRLTIYGDMSGNVSSGLSENRLEEFENVSDFSGMIIDPQWALKRRLEDIENQFAVLRSEIAQINRELGKDDDDIPF